MKKESKQHQDLSLSLLACSHTQLLLTRYLSEETLTRMRSSPTLTFSPSERCFDAGWMVHQHASPTHTHTSSVLQEIKQRCVHEKQTCVRASISLVGVRHFGSTLKLYCNFTFKNRGQQQDRQQTAFWCIMFLHSSFHLSAVRLYNNTEFYSSNDVKKIKANSSMTPNRG